MLALGPYFISKEDREKWNAKSRFKVITISSSMKFKDCFPKIEEDLILEGYIVIPLDVVTDADAISKDVHAARHRQKIDMSDEVYVINQGGYIGESVREEIEYAIQAGKKVRYSFPISI